jgi:hypothetical protein
MHGRGPKWRKGLKPDTLQLAHFAASLQRIHGQSRDRNCSNVVSGMNPRKHLAHKMPKSRAICSVPLQLSGISQNLALYYEFRAYLLVSSGRLLSLTTALTVSDMKVLTIGA